MTVRTPPNIMLRGGPAGLPGEVIALPLYHAPKRLADAMARRARAQFIGDLSEFGLPVPAEGRSPCWHGPTARRPWWTST
jgi:hypothetical protein